MREESLMTTVSQPPRDDLQAGLLTPGRLGLRPRALAVVQVNDQNDARHRWRTVLGKGAVGDLDQ